MDKSKAFVTLIHDLLIAKLHAYGFDNFEPILFNIQLHNYFYLTEMTLVCNFADDTTFYECDKDLNTLINRLKHDTTLAFEWFENTFMKLNQDKYYLLVSGQKHKTIWAKIREMKIWESNK